MSELDIQRRLTRAFINTQPVMITLTPRTRTKTSTGGVLMTDGVPRGPQKLRLVEPGDSGGRLPIRAADGLEREVEYILLGEHTAEIGKYDIFTYAGSRWEVAALMHDNGWEKRGLVVRFD